MSSGSGTGTPASSAASATVATRFSWQRGGMVFTLERIREPELEPVTLAEMIQHLREFTSISEEAQAQLQGLITAGREWVEQYTSRALVDQTWRLTVDGYDGLSMGIQQNPVSWPWPSVTELMLRRSPILGINSFISADSSGTETGIDSTAYRLCEPLSRYPRLAPVGGNFAAGALKVEYRAGYVDLTSSPQDGMNLVPARYKQAIKLWAEAHFDRDEKMMPILLQAAENLIKPERIDLGIS